MESSNLRTMFIVFKKKIGALKIQCSYISSKDSLYVRSLQLFIHGTQGQKRAEQLLWSKTSLSAAEFHTNHIEATRRCDVTLF